MLKTDFFKCSTAALYIGSLVVVCTVGCEQVCDYQLTEVHEAGPAIKTMARLDVSGMMCAHACGGKIKKELLEIPGVANATIDFENSRGVNFADVEYDPGQVSSDQLVAVITQIADGRLYGVDAVQVTHFAKAADLP